jgi:hypothetical protein
MESIADPFRTCINLPNPEPDPKFLVDHISCITNLGMILAGMILYLVVVGSIPNLIVVRMIPYLVLVGTIPYLILKGMISHLLICMRIC